MNKQIWVLPEPGGGEAGNKLAAKLLTGTRTIAEKTGGTLTVLVFGEAPEDFTTLLSQYGAGRALVFRDPLLKNPSAEAYAAALLPELRKKVPWLMLLGDTLLGRDLAPRLAAALETGLITGCARMDFSESGPVFYRPVFGGQLWQEVVFNTDKTMIVTIDPDILDDSPVA
jgi:electron transfer flavoprotein alpha subunit